MKHDIISLDQATKAQRLIAGSVVRTPLIRMKQTSDDIQIDLKLENLQPVGSFKLRGVTNTIKQTSKSDLSNGVWTVSAGNTAQALSWAARDLSIKATSIVPENAPKTKLDNISRLGGEYIKTPFQEFAKIFGTRKYRGMSGKFIHPFSDPMIMAGNATIGLEILEDLPDVDAVIAAYGGGGLCCGIASSIKAIKPDTKVYAAEASTSAPLAAAFEAGKPTNIEYELTFVDAIGSPIVQPEMFSLAKRLLDGSLVVEVGDIAESVRNLAKSNYVIAEGGGAVSVAAAQSGKAGLGKIACVVSGGNIDFTKLSDILIGKIPEL